MVSCPNCEKGVPTRPILAATGLAGVVCPHCNASLWPTYWRSALLLGLAMSFGYFEAGLLRRAGYGFPLDFVGWLAAMSASYVLLVPTILRLRVKKSSLTTLPIERV